MAIAWESIFNTTHEVGFRHRRPTHRWHRPHHRHDWTCTYFFDGQLLVRYCRWEILNSAAHLRQSRGRHLVLQLGQMPWKVEEAPKRSVKLDMRKFCQREMQGMKNDKYHKYSQGSRRYTRTHVRPSVGYSCKWVIITWQVKLTSLLI